MCSHHDTAVKMAFCIDVGRESDQSPCSTQFRNPSLCSSLPGSPSTLIIASPLLFLENLLLGYHPHRLSS
ncbi:hypothetical protein Nepgr_000936 [Nepenthes gracilis]|uniref:Uncharacterized protein n=1 Tax=Nepenthes gracilis TaxID=150966 RepID=A0AAD3P4H6_NEPGR|nr:hypothetical protein Nepgr_000936 [Nepenthes gracilis]